MSATVARPAPPPRTLPPQWRRTFIISFGMFTYVCKWFAAVMLLLAVLATGVYAAITTPTVSVLQFGLQAGIWFPFSMMIMIAVYLPVLIMNGITRKAAAQGAVATAVVAATLFAVGTVLLMLIEKLVFDQLGWVAGSVNNSGAPITSNITGTLIGLLTIYAAANISGLLISVVYYRLGALWGTIALPLTLSPLALTGLFGVSPSSNWRPWTAHGPEGLSELPAALRWDLGPAHPLLAVAIIAVAAFVFVTLTRRLTIDPKES